MCFFELRVGHVGINLSRYNRGMTQKFLYDTDIGTVGEKCCREAVAKGMSVHIFQYPCLQPIGLHHIGDKKA